MEILLDLIILFLVSAVVIWIVGKLGLGMEVSGFNGAIVAAIVIAIVGGIIGWLLSYVDFLPEAGFWGAVIAIIVAAVVLLISDRFVTGLKVKGFGGAIIAAIAIGVVYWLIDWVLGLFFSPAPAAAAALFNLIF